MNRNLLGNLHQINGRFALMVVLLFCVLGAKGQQEGLYYIDNYTNHGQSSSQRWYLVPADDPIKTDKHDAFYSSNYSSQYGDPAWPFLTTYQTNKDEATVPSGVVNNYRDNSIWIVKETGDGKYYIIHASSGKYVIYEPPHSAKPNRKSMHLLATDSPGENAKFVFISNSSGYNIRPQGISSGNRFFNPASSNKNTYHGDGGSDGDAKDYGGLIGLWSGDGDNSIWYTETALCEAPGINVDVLAGSYTITWHDSTWNQLPSGYFIRYTEDGSDPYENPNNTAMDYNSDIPIAVEHDGTVVKAVVVWRAGENDIMKLSGIATEEVNAATMDPDTPTFSVTCENELLITCNNMPLAQIYYTYTDGTTEPDTPSNDLTNPANHHYGGPISGFSDGYKVKAKAYNGNNSSEVSATIFMLNNEPPTLYFNPLNSSEVIVEFLEGQTVHYTTVIGGHPDPTDEGLTTSPDTITNQLENYDVLVIAIATSNDGRGQSCPVTEIRRPKKPTIKTNDVCNGNGERIQTMELTEITDQDIGAGKTYWYALSNGEGQTAPALNTFTQYTRNSVLNIMDIATAYQWDGSVWVTLHAYAKDAGGNNSVMVSKNYMLKHTAAPTISYVVGELETTVNITAVSGATIHYSIDGDDQTPEQNSVERTFQNGSSHTFTAWAQCSGEGASCEVTKIVRMPIPIDSLDDIVDADGIYGLTDNIEVPSTFTSISFPEGFTGSLNGNNHTISNLSVPLFNVIDGGTVNNLFFDNVNITAGNTNGNVGVVCSEATGASRIYNCGVLATNSTVTTDEDGYTIITDCSSTISGSNFVGGIVGLLDGSSRVINCFSYANITGGAEVGGIVGHNSVATTSSNLQTMVMNCMFYGDITDGTSKAPIYNGEIINNYKKNNVVGVSNFNYFWSGASYVQDQHINEYNCALSAETRYLQRFEFFRQLLNSHRELAAWWVTGHRSDKDEMLKWVMEPSQIGTSTPYPILKTPGKYPSVVNYDAANAVVGKPRNQGGKLGELTVNIQMGDGAQFTRPSGATIITSQLTLNITDKDTTHFNFNYYKVQLPYYNDVGSNNYTGNRVVTGWKIVSITVDGTPTTTGTGSYDTGADVTFDASGNITKTPYNFADRTSTKKDLYSVSGRVFSQGAYWDVPEGVTAITIEPYWAKAAYVADAYADVVYDKDMTTRSDVTNVCEGRIYLNGVSYPIAGSNQIVYTSISNAIASTALAPNTSHTVNDYAVVLVGNCHHVGSIEASKPYTLTSIDLDHDNEPDYTLILRFNGRLKFHPVKYDFLSLVGLGMAQKSADGFGSYNFGIPTPINWFEVTNTALFRVTQFEYDYSSDRVAAPIILQGGVMEQWVSGQNTPGNKTTYFHVGGNVWFKEFHLGCHQDKTYACKHPPISVTGGDFDAFHLTGLYADASNYNDDAECYVNGGRFGTVAGTGMDGIGHATNHTNGRITWLIDNADIKEFFAGGINDAKRAEGSINTIISNSYVDFFCGGPKFGDMNAGRTVKTTATDCTFGFFFGAGYGGNSYYSAPPGNFTYAADPWLNVTHGSDYNDEKQYNLDWDQWVNGDIKATLLHGNYANGVEYKGYHNDYISQFGGVSTEIDYQFLPFSDNLYNVARLFLKFVKFSLATTHSVTSTLTGCTINNGFYGGGSLGKVEGSVESVLDGCTVKCDAFGAGYSATLPTVPVMATGGFAKQPYYDKALGAYLPGEFLGSVDYTWDYKASISSTGDAIDKDNHILYTTIPVNDKTNLGKVTGNVFLTIKGNSIVFKNVFGGGAESQVGGNTEVKILGDTKILGNIYGGGDMGEVVGNTKVIINGDNQ